MRRLIDFYHDRPLILLGGTAAFLLALVLAFLYVQSGSSEEEKLASKLACERQYGTGKCVEKDTAWVPSDSAIPLVTLQPLATRTPRPSYVPPPTTPSPTPAPAATAPPTVAAPTPTPKKKDTVDKPSKLLITREGASSGQTAEFAVKENWEVSYRFTSDDATGASECTFGLRVRSPDGKDAGFNPLAKEGKEGDGRVRWIGTGTYYLEIAFTCSATDNASAEPNYAIAVYD